jgi:hypothetical protein
MTTTSTLTPAMVLSTASTVPATLGRNGRANARMGHKVFVSAIFRALPAQVRAGLALDAFKAQLLAWHQDDLIDLARCDISLAAEQSTQDASEIRAGGRSTFHTVVLPMSPA